MCADKVEAEVRNLNGRRENAKSGAVLTRCLPARWTAH